MRTTAVLVAMAIASFHLLACGSVQKPAYTEDKARSEVQQLITLYKEARAKFVIQKQEMIKAEDCSRATALKDAVVKMEQEANMSPEPSEDITKMRMELTEAEKNCLAK